MADPGCVDCGWKPGPGEKWPSEGRAAVRWIESLLICAEGDWFGKPIKLRADQKRFLWRWYEYCPGCGYWHYDQAVRGAATGDGKTTFVAAIECLELFGPPQIAPVSPNIINAAASFEQADILFSIAATMLGGRDQMIKEAPLCGYAEVYDTQIKRADGQPGVMRRVAAVAGTNEGGLPSLFVGDELHEWGDIGDGKARVHMVIGKSTKKRRLVCRVPLKDGEEYGGPGEIITKTDGKGRTERYAEIRRGTGRNLNISTAGFDVDHSLLGKMYKEGKKALKDPSLSPRLYFDWQEGPDGDYSDPAVRRLAVVAASAAAGVLWDVEARVREWGKAGVADHEWMRYYGNKWVDVSDASWLKDHPGAWKETEGAWEIFGDEPTVLAYDSAVSGDCAAVVEATELHDGRIAVTARIWWPERGLVDTLDIVGYIRDRAAELGVIFDGEQMADPGPRFRGIAYDPAFADSDMRKLESRYGLTVIEFSQQPISMGPACKLTYRLIVGSGHDDQGVVDEDEDEDRFAGRRLVHTADADFGRQVKNAVKHETERYFTLKKQKSQGKIDSAVAMCIAAWTLRELPEAVPWEDTVW